MRGKDCIFVVIEEDDGDAGVRISDYTRIKLADDNNQAQVRAFLASVKGFVSDHDIHSLTIRGRAKGGNFSGGVVTFKMEALIQSIQHCAVNIVASQSITSFCKKDSPPFPEMNTYAYLEEAFSVAYYNWKA